ncbi:hypothetical protein Tco_0772348 [Tanacetum coccineum]|uniref:Uncharacterized protein n=1 Tax=Tanacetum coccineum TaxID=301880 RepID=A0ABQ4ZL99_9ASTR
MEILLESTSNSSTVGADTSGGVFGNQGQASGSQAVGSQANIVENQVVGSQLGNRISEANGIGTQASVAGSGNWVN